MKKLLIVAFSFIGLSSCEGNKEVVVEENTVDTIEIVEVDSISVDSVIDLAVDSL